MEFKIRLHGHSRDMNPSPPNREFLEAKFLIKLPKWSEKAEYHIPGT